MRRSALEYTGHELPLFLDAANWKRYWVSQLRPFVTGDVLEVGAGLGANTALLKNSAVRSIHCLEPDEALADQLRATVRGDPAITVSAGTIDSVSGTSFDAVLYIDVLEHIEDDKGELARAARLLKTGGRLIVLAPAHQALFSAFDKAIGHHRRYDRRSLSACSPPSAWLENMWYLDCVGLLASAGPRRAQPNGRPPDRSACLRRLVGLSRWSR